MDLKNKCTVCHGFINQQNIKNSIFIRDNDTRTCFAFKIFQMTGVQLVQNETGNFTCESCHILLTNIVYLEKQFLEKFQHPENDPSENFSMEFKEDVDEELSVTTVFEEMNDHVDDNRNPIILDKDLKSREIKEESFQGVEESFESKHGQKSYKCKECFKIFFQKVSFEEHKSIHSEIEKYEKKTNSKRFQCNHCQKRFTTNSKLKKHVRLHTGEDILEHTNEKRFECQDCGKSFSSTYHLNRHESIHTGEKPFKCLECEKAFSAQDRLRRHQASIHNENRPFHCSECENAFFKTKDHLKRHIERVHIGSRPYNCNFCGKDFGTKDHAKRHEFAMHREKLSLEQVLQN